MILERAGPRSLPPSLYPSPLPSLSIRSYPLNRFSDIIELARLNEAWLLRGVNGKIDGVDGRGATVHESKRRAITIPDRPRGHNFSNLRWTAKRKLEVEESGEIARARYTAETFEIYAALIFSISHEENALRVSTRDVSIYEN